MKQHRNSILHSVSIADIYNELAIRAKRNMEIAQKAILKYCYADVKCYFKTFGTELLNDSLYTFSHCIIKNIDDSDNGKAIVISECSSNKSEYETHIIPLTNIQGIILLKEAIQ